MSACATSPSSPTSTMARPPSSTGCCSSPAACPTTSGWAGAHAVAGSVDAERRTLTRPRLWEKTLLCVLLVGLIGRGGAGGADPAFAGHGGAAAGLQHLHRNQPARDEVDAGAAVFGGDVEA